MDRQILRRAVAASTGVLGRGAGGRATGGLGDAEAALVRHYGRLARIAYLILPAGPDRRRRLLTAHGVVQRALPARGAAVTGDPAAVYAALRVRVVRGALAAARRPGPRLLPRVWGLRLFTADGTAAELAVDRALTELSPAGRAAYALRRAEQLPPEECARVLTAAGVPEAGGALRQADRLSAESPLPADELTGSARFDPCTVRVRPGDLLRRRRTARLAVCGVLVLAAGATWALPLPDSSDRAPVTRTSNDRASNDRAGTPDRTRALRAAPDLWQRTARLDLSAWPARGDLLGDQDLIGRALDAWRTGHLQLEPGTRPGPPGESPQLLYAGRVGGAAVVLLYDGGRLGRFTDGPAGGLLLARADDSDVVTGAAVVLRREGAGTRFLLAPWVESVESRLLRQPDSPARSVDRTDGVTVPVTTGAGGAVATAGTTAAAGAGGGCLDGAVLQLRSSRTVAEKHAFLLADLGGLLPAHLTYTPLPQQGEARSPREATGTDALVTWARTACAVPERAPGVKSLNAWAFAQQALPRQAGSATWVCLRTDRWNGTGSAATELLLPAARPDEPARRTALAEGRGCSRYDQHTVGWTRWRSPDGHDYLLAAGSRRVTRITVTGPRGDAEHPAPDRTLALENPPADPVTVAAVLDDGTRISPLADRPTGASTP
ncbi:hypothetical protein [Kitasatospora sp. NPDC094015]|uniref:hypothetical protein n=1 Tax=Kitasatospora sp. NPDC094015 TaxID=3155205 RepID=UPI00331E0166